MDNVTHSLFGYALARAVIGRDTSPARARAFTAAAVIASNAPDFDFVIPAFAHNRTLGYLLHHRGHTHTLLLAAPLGAVVGLGCARWFRTGRTDAALGAWLGALAAWLHIAFDYMNNYGVHPFWPLDDRWRYGDSVFIVEPLLLAALLPLLALAAEPRAARWLGWALSALLLVLCFRVDSFLVAARVAVFSVVMLLVQRRARGSASPALVASACVLALFFAAGAVARARVTDTLLRQRPNETLLQLATAPLPGDPWSWQVVAVSAERAAYHVRLAQLHLSAPPIASAEGSLLGGPTTARLDPPDLADTPSLHFTGVFTESIAALRSLARDHCEARAMLRFLRAPYFQREGARVVLGDLRYDREKALGFAEIALNENPHACEDPEPPWEPPLASLLR